MSYNYGKCLCLLLSILTACLLLVPDAEARRKQPPRIVVWSQPQLNISLAPGEKTTLSISFSPTKRLSKASLFTSDALKPFLTLGPSSYRVIKKGQVVSVSLSIEVPPNAIPGVHVGELALKIGRRNLTDTVKVNITVLQGPPIGDDDNPSEGTVSLLGSSELSFNRSGSDVDFVLNGAMFGAVSALYRNGEFIDTNTYSVEPTRLLARNLLVDGRNEILLMAADHLGRGISAEFTLWAGSNSLSGQLLDENGSSVDGATVIARLGDDQSVVAMAQVVGGLFTFSHFPGRTIILEAAAENNRFGAAAIGGADGTVSMSLSAIEIPSPIDNNNFSLGTAGWNIGSAPISLVDHVEENPTPTTPLQGAEIGKMAAGSDVDLALATSGPGPQQIKRSFAIKPGTKSVTVRYRFITSEIPGGYFGSEYNDAFNVTIRAQQSGAIKSEANSMNGLGRSAFDASGATPWREVSLNTVAGGDIIQVDLKVVNVEDGLYDSSLIVDLIEEKSLAITQLDLLDIDNSKLTALSVDQHKHFNGKTIIHGAVTVEGNSDDSLASLVLDVLDEGAVIATANLAPAASSSLLTLFGPDEKIERTGDVLFAFSPPALSGDDRTLSLRVRAQSLSGQTATLELGKVQLLVNYKDLNRYPPRPCSASNDNCNEDEGGDGWARPSLRELAQGLANLQGLPKISWGDFSNMNGGYIYPHKTHKTGVDVDGWYAGYNNRDSAAAATMIGILNSALGPQIKTVWVSFQENPSDAFWMSIKDVMLNHGIPAIKVIRPYPNHTGHFHMLMK